MSLKTLQLKTALEHRDSFTTILVLICMDTYGTEFLGWLPETVYAELAQDFQSQIPSLNQDKIAAGMHLLNSNAFYKDLSEHCLVANVLSGSPASFEVFDPSDIAEEAWAVTEAMLLAPPDSIEPNPFDDQIRRYIGKLADDAGLISMPDSLTMAIRDEEPAARISQQYSDDVVLYQGILEVSQSKVDAINNMVAENMSKLLQQLENMPIGNAADVAQQLRTKLGLT